MNIFQVAAFRSMVNIITRYESSADSMKLFYRGCVNHSLHLKHWVFLLINLNVYSAECKLNHLKELKGTAILSSMLIMHLMTLVGAMSLSIQAFAVYGEVLPEARYLALCEPCYYAKMQFLYRKSQVAILPILKACYFMCRQKVTGLDLCMMMSSQWRGSS